MSENKKVVLTKKLVHEKRSDYTNIQEVSFINMLYLNQSFIEEKELKKNLNKKLSSYKNQDKKKNRYNEDKFITQTELIDKLFFSQIKCYYCSCNVYLFYNNNVYPTTYKNESNTYK